jgi:hypothetical protein
LTPLAHKLGKSDQPAFVERMDRGLVRTGYVGHLPALAPYVDRIFNGANPAELPGASAEVESVSTDFTTAAPEGGGDEDVASRRASAACMLSS